MIRKQSNSRKEAGMELPVAISLPILVIAIAGTAALHYYLIAPSGAQTANPKRMGQLYLIILAALFFAIYLPVRFVCNHRSKKRDPFSAEQIWWNEDE